MRLKLFQLTITVLAAILITGTANCADKAKLELLYKKSGMEKQNAEFPALVKMGFDQARANNPASAELPDYTLQAIYRNIRYAYDPEQMKKIMLKHLGEKLSAKDLTRVLRWLNSPIGINCTRLEEEASTPEAMVEIQRFAGQLQSSPPSEERLETVTSLDKAVRATEFAVEASINTQIAIVTAITATLPTEQQTSIEELVSLIQRSRPELEAVLHNQTLISFLYTYRSMPISDLKNYIGFARTQAGQNYHSAAIEGLQEALLKAAISMGEAIASELNQSNSRTVL